MFGTLANRSARSCGGRQRSSYPVALVSNMDRPIIIPASPEASACNFSRAKLEGPLHCNWKGHEGSARI